MPCLPGGFVTRKSDEEKLSLYKWQQRWTFIFLSETISTDNPHAKHGVGIWKENKGNFLSEISTLKMIHRKWNTLDQTKRHFSWPKLQFGLEKFNQPSDRKKDNKANMYKKIIFKRSEASLHSSNKVLGWTCTHSCMWGLQHIQMYYPSSPGDLERLHPAVERN